MDRIIDSIVERLGNLETAYLVGDIDQTNLADLVTKTEKYIGRKIRTLVVGADEFMSMKQLFSQKPILLLWENGE